MHRRRSSDSEAVMPRPSRASVPFSWENEPGMSKVVTVVHDHRDHKVLSEHLNMALKLKPPPCLSTSPGRSSRFMVVDRQTRLPLCSIQPSLRLNSFRLIGGGVKKEEDPFLAALMKCRAKNPNSPAGNYGEKKVKTMFSFSCKYSCGVREDSIIKMPQSPK